MPTYTTRVITDESQVPEGYVRLKEWGSPEQQHISKAHQGGLIPAVKLMRNITDTHGPTWVDKEKAEEFLNGINAHKKQKVVQLDSKLFNEYVTAIAGELTAIREALQGLEADGERTRKACEALVEVWGKNDS